MISGGTTPTNGNDHDDYNVNMLAARIHEIEEGWRQAKETIELVHPLILHIKQHATLDFKIVKLDPKCEFCQKYHGDKLGHTA